MSDARVTAPDPAPRSLSQWETFVHRLEGGLCAPGESQEERLRKVHLTTASMFVVPAGVVWGALYLAAGEPVAAAFPLGYAAVTLIGLALLLRWGADFERFRLAQQVSIFVLPVGLHLVLGGFVGSSGAILWSSVAVLMSLLFGRGREARAWFAGFVAVLVAGALLQPSLTAENNLPGELVLAFFVLNPGAVSLVIFLVLHSFLADRRKLRELEVAYLEQELALRQSEKLATLGTLAAGMAHELNNPIAAARRGVATLRALIERLHGSYGEAVARPSSEHLVALERAALLLRSGTAVPSDLSPLDRSDRGEDIEDWMEGLGLELRGSSAAEALVRRGLTRRILEGEAENVARSARRLFAARIALGSAGDTVLDEVAACTERVSRIVSAHGSALNQVWTNIVQNAMEAMGGTGTLVLRIKRANGTVTVEIEDDGPGMTTEVAARAFDPFFTTKPPGAGAGLGLTVAHNIVVRQHGGRIAVESRPGRALVRVELPIGPGRP